MVEQSRRGGVGAPPSAAGDTPWKELTGGYGQRLRAAIGAVDALVAGGWRFAEPIKPSSDKAEPIKPSPNNLVSPADR